MATKQSTITTTIQGMDAVDPSIRLDFDNGAMIYLMMSELSDDIKKAALMHGLKQKLVDAAAISRNTETGRAASTQDKFDAVKEVYDRLLAGQWNKGREGGAGATSGGLLFRALSRMYPAKTAEQLRAYLDGLDAKQQAALRKNPKVAVVIAELQAAKAAPDDDLLAGLED